MQPVVVGLVALVTLIGLIGPAIKSPSPHDIAVGLVGPPPATQQIAGAAALLGRPGVALAALVAVLLDLVCSGGPIGSQLLPDAYRWLAPAMPAGQLYSGIRGALYFDNAGVGEPVTVLSMWVAGGLVLLLLGALVTRRAARGANR